MATLSYTVLTCDADGCDEHLPPLPGGSGQVRAVARALHGWRRFYGSHGLPHDYCPTCGDLRLREIVAAKSDVLLRAMEVRR